MDVIEEEWTSEYNLEMIFEYFLPQLLTEPNPNSPANGGAAQIFYDRPEEYKEIVLESVRQYASEEAYTALNLNENSNFSE